MVVGFAAMVLILYNGIIDRPAPDQRLEFGISLEYGYWLALLALGRRSPASPSCARSRARARERKAPGTV